MVDFFIILKQNQKMRFTIAATAILAASAIRVELNQEPTVAEDFAQLSEEEKARWGWFKRTFISPAARIYCRLIEGRKICSWFD